MSSTNKSDINDALNKLNSADVNKKLGELKDNEELMGQLAEAVTNNPQLASMAPKLAGDSRVKDFMDSHPDMNKKQALQMKKQMNKAAHSKRMKMGKIEACMINPSRKLKPITIFLEKGEPSEKEITNHIGASHMHKRETDLYQVYYDSASKAKNKRAARLFEGITGYSIIILSKDGDLSTETFEKWEKSVLGGK